MEMCVVLAGKPANRHCFFWSEAFPGSKHSCLSDRRKYYSGVYIVNSSRVPFTERTSCPHRCLWHSPCAPCPSWSIQTLRSDNLPFFLLLPFFLSSQMFKSVVALSAAVFGANAAPGKCPSGFEVKDGGCIPGVNFATDSFFLEWSRKRYEETSNNALFVFSEINKCEQTTVAGRSVATRHVKRCASKLHAFLALESEFAPRLVHC